MVDAVGTTHHIKLNGVFYTLKPGSYRKQVAPQFGSRFTTGDPDYNNLSIWQHWVQKCWIGGADQTEWNDDAMYDDGVGVETLGHDRVTLARGFRRITTNGTISSGTTAYSAGARFAVYNGTLYVLTFSASGVSSKLWSYSSASDTMTQIAAFTGVVARSIATFDGKLFIGGVNTAGTAAIVQYSSGSLAAWTTLTNPAGVGTRTVTAMRAFQQKLYVAYGTSVWRLKDDQTWDGTTVFYKADQNSESNSIISMEVHLGYLYMLSNNGHVHRTDGNATFDLWNWEGGVRGVALRSFDGRLFVLTFEYTNTTSVGWGCIYQMSGSAMTQLKRWGDETVSTEMGNMTVYDGRLWYGASNLLAFGNAARSGFGVACYDPIEDSHSIAASNTDNVTYAPGALPYSNYIVDDQIFFGGRMVCLVRGHGIFWTPYQYRDILRGIRQYDISESGAALGSRTGGWFTTSTYDAGTPGLNKLWRKVVVDYTLPSTSTQLYLEYSINGGSTWVVIGGITTVGTRVRRSIWLENVSGNSFKLRFTLRSTTVLETPQIHGFIVSYLPLPEPNWMWSFTIVLSANTQLMDGTIRAVDTEAAMTALAAAYRAKAMVTFQDVDGTYVSSGGTSPGVIIYDIAFVLPQLTQPLEGEVNVVLVEAVETY